MFADWSCTVLVRNRTCYGKYRIFKLIIDLCYSLISGLNLYDNPYIRKINYMYLKLLDVQNLNYEIYLQFQKIHLLKLFMTKKHVLKSIAISLFNVSL